jgi:hypothetical protein
MPLTITQKLIRVARHTYDIQPDGSLPDTPDSLEVGYRVPATKFVAGPDRIDAALVGETDSEIIVAFRGTLPPNYVDEGEAGLDWLDDFDALLVPDPGIPGNVHQGFLSSLDAVWGDIGPAVHALVAASPAKPVYVTGHSKGGAVANLAAMRLKPALPDATPLAVVTFAAARAGDQDFANAYAAAITRSDRYEYADDIVPHIPPSDAFADIFQDVPIVENKLAQWKLGYVSVGTLHFFDWEGGIDTDSALLRLRRLTALGQLVIKSGGLTIIAGDHSIALGSGYAKGVDSLP